MTRHNIPLGRILGIPIGLDFSWFVIFALSSGCWRAVTIPPIQELVAAAVLVHGAVTAICSL